MLPRLCDVGDDKEGNLIFHSGISVERTPKVRANKGAT